MARKNPARKRMQIELVPKEAKKYGFRALEPIGEKERTLSPNEAARILGITGEAIKMWIYTRRLPAVKLSNGYWRIRVADLEAYMAARQRVDRKRIMLLDKDQGALDRLSQIVLEMNHVAVVAHNFSDAILKASDLVPTLFIVNVSQDPEGAWRFIEKVRSHRSLRRMPVVLLADSDLKEKDAERALDLEIQGMLKSPVTAKILTEEITRVLGRIM